MLLSVVEIVFTIANSKRVADDDGILETRNHTLSGDRPSVLSSLRNGGAIQDSSVDAFRWDIQTIVRRRTSRPAPSDVAMDVQAMMSIVRTFHPNTACIGRRVVRPDPGPGHGIGRWRSCSRGAKTDRMRKTNDGSGGVLQP